VRVRVRVRVSVWVSVCGMGLGASGPRLAVHVLAARVVLARVLGVLHRLEHPQHHLRSTRLHREHGLVGEVEDRRGEQLRRHLLDAAHELRLTLGLSRRERGGATLAGRAALVRRAASTHETVATRWAVAAVQPPPVRSGGGGAAVRRTLAGHDASLTAPRAHGIPLGRGTHAGVRAEHGVVAVRGRVQLVHARCPDAAHDAGRAHTGRALFPSRDASLRVDRLVVALRCPRARLGRWRGPRRVARNAREGVSAPETSVGCGALVTSRPSWAAWGASHQPQPWRATQS
jgi:hypothetical protein